MRGKTVTCVNCLYKIDQYITQEKARYGSNSFLFTKRVGLHCVCIIHQPLFIFGKQQTTVRLKDPFSAVVFHVAFIRVYCWNFPANCAFGCNALSPTPGHPRCDPRLFAILSFHGFSGGMTADVGDVWKIIFVWEDFWWSGLDLKYVWWLYKQSGRKLKGWF